MPVSSYSHLLGSNSRFYSVKDRSRVDGTIQQVTRHKLKNGRYSYIARGIDDQGRKVTKIVANDTN